MEMCESILDGELSSCLIIDPEAIVYGLYDNYTKYLEGEDYPKITGLKLRMVQIRGTHRMNWTAERLFSNIFQSEDTAKETIWG